MALGFLAASVLLFLSAWVPSAPRAKVDVPGGGIDTSAARACFERFKALDGDWVGRSTRGWEETVRYRVIAGGSVLMQTSFDAHPNETMVTMITLDCGQLSLTHYCVAGNQPRLRATRISPDGEEVHFTFRDGGNLHSRDQGHMDRAVYRFHGADKMTTRWTWFQNGQERWMEAIALERKQ